MYDSDADNNLSLNELCQLLQDIGNKITALPAVRMSYSLITNSTKGGPLIYQTAQVAAQQGKYVGKKLHKLARRSSDLPPDQLSDASDEDIYGPFKYLHLGSLAYIGNAAVFDLGNYSFMGGLAAMYAWRSVYWNEQVSARTRALLMIDWIIR